MVSESEYVGIKNTCSVCGKPITITLHRSTPNNMLKAFRDSEKAKCSVCEPYALWMRD